MYIVNAYCCSSLKRKRCRSISPRIENSPPFGFDHPVGFKSADRGPKAGDHPFLCLNAPLFLLYKQVWCCRLEMPITKNQETHYSRNSLERTHRVFSPRSKSPLQCVPEIGTRTWRTRSPQKDFKTSSCNSSDYAFLCFIFGY